MALLGNYPKYQQKYLLLELGVLELSAWVAVKLEVVGRKGWNGLQTPEGMLMASQKHLQLFLCLDS